MSEWQKTLKLNLRRIRASKTFDELMALVESYQLKVFSIGPLMSFDTALGIGANMGLEPEKVFAWRDERRCKAIGN